VIHSPEDREICERFLKSAKKRGDCAKPISELVVATGRHFLGAPYKSDTLEREGSEELVVNLSAFDCVTFVENAVVLADLIRSEKGDFDSFAAALERVRYRGGRCEGYSSRLHYFTDWLYDNGRKGVVRDVTRQIGGVPYRKMFHALTDRREDHSGLKEETVFHRMRVIEGVCSRRHHFFIPKAYLSQSEGQIKEGDLIAIATDERGLDVRHVGLAVRLREELHLLHASSTAGKVVLSEISLERYLLTKRSRTGIIVGRVI
jgi:hypothetical protein